MDRDKQWIIQHGWRPRNRSTQNRYTFWPLLATECKDPTRENLVHLDALTLAIAGVGCDGSGWWMDRGRDWQSQVICNYNPPDAGLDTVAGRYTDVFLN